MRSESATVIRSFRFCVPVLCFSSGIPVASAEHGAGTFCHWVMAFVLALERRSEKDVQRTGSP